MGDSEMYIELIIQHPSTALLSSIVLPLCRSSTGTTRLKIEGVAASLRDGLLRRRSKSIPIASWVKRDTSCVARS